MTDNNSAQEMQFIEQGLQQILYQKQAFQMELAETKNALDEIKKSPDDVYKVIGNIMIKSKKDDMLKDLQEKHKLLDLRLKSLEKQEKALLEQLEKQRNELLQKKEKK